jgi:hypothetical protein
MHIMAHQAPVNNFKTTAAQGIPEFHQLSIAGLGAQEGGSGGMPPRPPATLCSDTPEPSRVPSGSRIAGVIKDKWRGASNGNRYANVETADGISYKVTFKSDLCDAYDMAPLGTTVVMTRGFGFQKPEWREAVSIGPLPMADEYIPMPDVAPDYTRNFDDYSVKAQVQSAIDLAQLQADLVRVLADRLLGDCH